MANLVKTFSADGDFAAMREMEGFLGAAGFSVGSNERGAPRGIMFGHYRIAKWRNMGHYAHGALHGKVTGSMRYGPVTVTIFETAPQEAKRAFHNTLAHQ